MSASQESASGTSEKLLSVVIPVYNEEEVLPIMRARLDEVLSKVDMRVEIVLVDDGSRDRTAEVLRKLADEDPRYRAVLLSRNYGHQVALSAGIDHAAGDAVVVLDADLQDPPELIPEMLARWRDGYHVVYGKRTSRAGESFMKRLTASVFYRLIRSLSGVEIPADVGDFRLMDRKVVEALKRMPERFRFVRGMVAWAGFRQCPIEFERPQRAAGETKYPWRRMMAFAVDAIFSFSVVPLRLATIVGLLVLTAAIGIIAYTLYLRFVVESVIPGFSAMYIAILSLGGLNLVLTGVLGEYIGRVYVEVKGRPLYVVQELVSSDKS